MVTPIHGHLSKEVRRARILVGRVWRLRSGGWVARENLGEVRADPLEDPPVG